MVPLHYRWLLQVDINTTVEFCIALGSVTQICDRKRELWDCTSSASPIPKSLTEAFLAGFPDNRISLIFFSHLPQTVSVILNCLEGEIRFSKMTMFVIYSTGTNEHISTGKGSPQMIIAQLNVGHIHTTFCRSDPRPLCV